MTHFKGFPDLPPIWWLGSMLVIYLGKWIAPSLHPSSPVLVTVSWIGFFLAFGLIAWAAFWFFRKKTPIEPHHQASELIVEGPYRITRNPIYLALVTLTLASSIGHGSLIGLAAAIGLWKILDVRFAEPEETSLLITFGEKAEAYFKSTRRWL